MLFSHFLFATCGLLSCFTNIFKRSPKKSGLVRQNTLKKQRRMTSLEDKTSEHAQSDSVLHESATEALNIMCNTISLDNLSTKENFTEKCLLSLNNADISHTDLYEQRA